MNLSNLAYLSVKNAIYYADDSFDYESFTKGEFDKDSDYSLSINNVFSPINEAITRLIDLDKIPYRIKQAEVNGRLVSLESLSTMVCGKEVAVKEVVSVADLNYEKIPHTQFGLDGILLPTPKQRVLVEFKQELPLFFKEDLGRVNVETGEFVANNIELKEFGINDSMCNYIIEYAQGKLLEPIAPELANMHITRAETYFSHIKSVGSAFRQQRVEKYFVMPDQEPLEFNEVLDDLLAIKERNNG